MTKILAAADAAADGVFLRGADGRLVCVSPSCERITGYRPVEFLSDPGLFRRIVDPEDRSHLEEHWCGSMDAPSVPAVELRLVHREGRLVWISCSWQAALGPDGDTIGRTVIVRDVSEKKRMELEGFTCAERLRVLAGRCRDQRRLMMALRAEVVERAHSEHVERERAEGRCRLASETLLNEQRQRCRVANIVHDQLRQLLVGAKYRLEPLLILANQSDREVARSVSRILSEMNEMTRSLVADLRPPQLHRGGLIAGIRWLAQSVNAIGGTAINVHADELAVAGVTAFDLLLCEGVRELLLNVVQHSGAGSAEVRVKRMDDDIQIQVADAGVGFDPHQLAAKPGSADGGLGGLRSRIEAVGGRMEVESAPGRGCRVTMRAPAAATGSADVETIGRSVMAIGRDLGSSSKSARRRQGIRTLIVDDHPVMRQGLGALLTAYPDIELVGAARSGEAAIEMARRLRPDVIVMDVRMPGMGGIEATRLVHAEHPNIRVIGLSMIDEGGWADAMRHAGATTFVSKSGPPAVLIAAIRGSSGGAPKVSLGKTGRRRAKSRIVRGKMRRRSSVRPKPRSRHS